MAVLHGIVAPSGEGLVIEAHLDIIAAPTSFFRRLKELGFENDPFLEFHPTEYKYHYTGRTRALKSEMNSVLDSVESLVHQVLGEARDANVDLYAEWELVRQIRHFGESDSIRSLAALDDFTFETSSDPSPAKADVHVEFLRSTVPSALHDLLVSKHFYWVVTPASDLYPSEEIATLQTSTFNDASRVFERLVESPLPVCTGIHLEQKLGMIPSRSGLHMPPVTKVVPHFVPQTTEQTLDFVEALSK